MWRRGGEQTGPVLADTRHVLGGRCRAVEAADSGRKRALGVIAQMRREVTERKVVKGGQRGGRQGEAKGDRGARPGLEGVVEILDGARAALAGAATERDREERQWRHWRQLLAGALPKPGDALGEGESKQVAKAMVAGSPPCRKK